MYIIVIFITVLIIYLVQDILYERILNKQFAIDVTLFFSSDRAFEGDDLYMTEVITNKKYLPLPWVSVKLQLPKNLKFYDNVNSVVTDNYYRNDLFSILMFQRITRKADFNCTRRGYYRIKNINVVTSNIFVTKKFVSERELFLELYVYPKLIDISDIDIPYKRLLGSIIAKQFINPDPFEFRGIREYQTYDSFSQINFKQTAKTGKLMVNLHDHTISQEIVIILNLQKYRPLPNEPLYEDAIRLSASLAEYYIESGIPVSFIYNDGAIERGTGSGHIENIFDVLARIDLNADFRPISKILPDYMPDADSAYILISTYHEKDLQDVFEEMRENSIDCMWIIPVDSEVNAGSLPDDNIFVWSRGYGA